MSSVRRAAVALLVLAAAVSMPGCKGKSKEEMTSLPKLNSPQTTSSGGDVGCPDIAGEHRAMFKTSCGSTGWGWVQITQQGCKFRAIYRLLGTFEGTLQGNSAPITLVFDNPCSGSATGTLTVSGKTINGTFLGAAAGASQQCCNPISGTFQFTRE